MAVDTSVVPVGDTPRGLENGQDVLVDVAKVYEVDTHPNHANVIHVRC